MITKLIDAIHFSQQDNYFYAVFFRPHLSFKKQKPRNGCWATHRAALNMVLGGGLEPPSKPNKTGVENDTGTQIGTHAPTLPPELLEIVDVWEHLPEHIRLSVLALVRTVKGGGA